METEHDNQPVWAKLKDDTMAKKIQYDQATLDEAMKPQTPRLKKNVR